MLAQVNIRESHCPFLHLNACYSISISTPRLLPSQLKTLPWQALLPRCTLVPARAGVSIVTVPASILNWLPLLPIKMPHRPQPSNRHMCLIYL